MKKYLLILFFIIIGISAKAQNDELNKLADLVSSLKNGGRKSYVNAVEALAKDKLWTPMDELGIDKDVECNPSDRVCGFRLNSIMTNAENKERYQTTTGNHLNGTDQRYNYSLIEKTLKPFKTATFELEGRHGEQVIIILPFNPVLSARAFCEKEEFKVSKLSDGRIKLTGHVTEGKPLNLSITNDSGENISYVILNYNSRNSIFVRENSAEATIRDINELISKGNMAYEKSQRTIIRECADSASHLLEHSGLGVNDYLDLSASIYKLYGNFHYENSEFDLAGSFYDKAQEIIDSNPEISFKSLTKLLILRDKAQLYYRLENYSSALEMMEKANTIVDFMKPYDLGSDDWMTVKLTYAMCLARMKEYDAAIDIAKKVLSGKDKQKLSYAKCERMYAKILLLAEANRDDARKAYRHYFESQKEYAMKNFGNMDSRQRSEYWETLRPFITDCYQLEESDPGLLYDVCLFSKGLLLQLTRLSGEGTASTTALKSLSYNWHDIQKRLTDTEGKAIEFIQYEKDGKKKMSALVLSPSGEPSFIHLTSPDEIASLGGKALQTTSRFDKDGLYSNGEIHNLIWTEPLLQAIKGTKRIYFSPDGYLHRLAIEYMPPVREFELYRLSSTRKLMEEKNGLAAQSPTLFFGGINYDFDKEPANSVQNDGSAYENYRGKSFSHLNFNEAKIIYGIRNNAEDNYVTASSASEKHFRELSPNYESILISTHGDFCSTSGIPTDIKASGEDITMSENIIALAGANSYLRNGSFNASDNYDGLLSAKEISMLNLSRCKLFTISACQSALGNITADGVFGLQRGLKNAGADILLLSLWNVNSEATALLMESFYSNLNNGMAPKAAFMAARNELMDIKAEPSPAPTGFNAASMSSRRNQRSKNKSFNSPQYLDAFIMIDALD